MTLDWFRRHLVEDIMPRWLEAAPTPNGLYFPHLDRFWKRRSAAPITLVSQSRLVHNFAAAYRATGDERYLTACRDGASALLRFFATERAGAYRWSVTLDGEPADPTLNLYGHAFVIFGLAHAFGVTGDRRFHEAAWDAAAFLDEAFRDGHGGFRMALDERGRDTGSVRSQNPVMHLFEAFCTLVEEAHDGEAPDRAASIGAWVLGRLLRPDGMLPEFYHEDWTERSSSDGGRIDIGHQFEWAFLLSRSAELGVWAEEQVGEVLRAAETLLDSALRMGYDRAEGGVWSPADAEGHVRRNGKGWWEQCEALRAMLHWAVARGRGDLLGQMEQTMRFCEARLMDATYGGWFMRVEADGTVPNTDKGNVWKVDYHVVGLCREAIRLLRAAAGDCSSDVE